MGSRRTRNATRYIGTVRRTGRRYVAEISRETYSRTGGLSYRVVSRERGPSAAGAKRNARSAISYTIRGRRVTWQ